MRCEAAERRELAIENGTAADEKSALVDAVQPARGLRIWLVMRVARQMIHNTYKGSRAITRWRGGEGSVDLRGSIFCEVRARVQAPLCEFYAASLTRLMALFDLDAEIGITSCRATGTGKCLMNVTIRATEAAAA